MDRERRIDFLRLSGTNNEVGPFKQDSIIIIQDKNTYTRLKGLQLDCLKIKGSGVSHFDFTMSNKIGYLNINIKNSSVINFQKINFKQIEPVSQDSAAMVLYEKSFDDLRHSAKNYKY